MSSSAAGSPSRIELRRAQARKTPSHAYIQRRNELELAAAAIMRRKGFEDMTLADLADEVGADRASLYYYTGGKEELLASMVLRALVENEAAFEAIADQGGSVAGRLHACIKVLIERYDRHFPYLYIWVHRDFRGEDGIKQRDLDRIRQLSQSEFDFIESLIREGIESGELETALPVGIVAQTVVGLTAWTYRWYEPGHGLSAGGLADGLADIALKGLVRATQV